MPATLRDRAFELRNQAGARLQDISTNQASITDDDGWKTFFFSGYGFRPEANRALIAAIGRFPYIADARNRHEAWERRFEVLSSGASL